MKLGFILATVLLAFAATVGAACEKSNDVLISEQIQEAQQACAKGCVDPPPGCVLKGNIGRTGLKFFVPPSDERYELIIVEPAKGEYWFCTQAEALANGFQPAPASGN